MFVSHDFKKLIHLTVADRKRHVTGLAILILLGSFMEAAGIGIIFPFLELVTDPDSIRSYPLATKAIALFGLNEPRHLLIAGALGILAVIIAKNLVLIWVIRERARFQSKGRAELAEKMLNGYMRWPFGRHLGLNTATLVRNVQSSCSTIYASAYAMIELFMEILVMVMLGCLLIAVDPGVTLVVGAVIGLAFLVFARIFPRRMARLGAKTNHFNQQGLQFLGEAFNSIIDVRLRGRESGLADRYAVISSNYAKVEKKRTLLVNMPRIFFEVVLVSGLLLVVVMVLATDRNPADLIPVLGLFAAAAFRLLPSFNRITQAINNVKFGAAPAAALYADLQTFEPRSATDGLVRPWKLSESIAIHNLSFAYPGIDLPTLRDVDFEIRKGMSVALVGRSGAGKTTLVNLLLGLLEPVSGKILADGRPISEDILAWQRGTGYVPQSVYLIDDTLRANIALGVPEDEIDPTGLRRALRLARLDGFVESLPLGLDTPAGELGSALSGGQRQRVGIARALYDDPSVVVLDEATSALDTHTEKEIGDTIHELTAEGRTLIVVAHRLATVRRCNRIALLDQGRLVAEGTYAKLLNTSDLFRDIVHHDTMRGTVSAETTEAASV